MRSGGIRGGAGAALRWLVLMAGVACGGGTGDDPEPPGDAPRDLDQDGYVAVADGGEDCDDGNAGVYPGAPEVCDGRDQDCDGEVDEAVRTTFAPDDDFDGFGDDARVTEGCVVPGGHTAQLGDCDDAAAAVFPGAPETCNGVDDDCDAEIDEDAEDAETWYLDDDGDDHGLDDVTLRACMPPDGYAPVGGDCDDARPDIHPGAPEDCLVAEDRNCDGAFGAVDTDGDGFFACEECNDADIAVFPGAPEQCNFADDDCNGLVDDGLDQDDDGVTVCAGDCDDTRDDVLPGGVEIPYDGVDQDCDGGDLVDVDGDGFAAEGVGGDDCDDDDPLVHPGVAFDDWDGVDDDCDGVRDDGPFTARYSVEILAIWTQHCLGGCHAGFTPSDQLDLSGDSYGVLVGVPSKDVPTMDRVTPFSTADSYLWYKLNDTQLTVGGAGVYMPKGDPLLPAADLDLIAAWIEEGAPP